MKYISGQLIECIHCSCTLYIKLHNISHLSVCAATIIIIIISRFKLFCWMVSCNELCSFLTQQKRIKATRYMFRAHDTRHPWPVMCEPFVGCNFTMRMIRLTLTRIIFSSCTIAYVFYHFLLFAICGTNIYKTSCEIM